MYIVVYIKKDIQMNKGYKYQLFFILYNNIKYVIHIIYIYVNFSFSYLRIISYI